jgi:hypothetical protein
MNFLSAAIPILVITCALALPVTTEMGAPASSEIPPSVPWTWPLPPEQPRVRHLNTVITPRYTRKAMIVVRNEGATYEAGTAGQGKITAAPVAVSGNYNMLKTTSDCTVVAGCHN